MRLLDMRTFFLEIITQRKSNSLGVLRFQCTDVSFISSVTHLCVLSARLRDRWLKGFSIGNNVSISLLSNIGTGNQKKTRIMTITMLTQHFPHSLRT